MSYPFAVIGAFITAVVAASVAHHLSVLSVAPDIVLIFAACWAMIRGQKEAMLVVPVAGLLRDLITSDPVGTSVLALSPIVLLAAVRDLRPVESEFLPTLAVVAAATLAYMLVSSVVLTAVGDDVPWGMTLLRLTVTAMVVNPLFTVLIYPPMRWLSPRPRPESFGVGSAVRL